MGDDADYAIEVADAGASATIPMEAGQIKKGGYVLSFAMVRSRRPGKTVLTGLDVALLRASRDHRLFFQLGPFEKFHVSVSWKIIFGILTLTTVFILPLKSTDT